VNLASIDLNLLLAFDALMTERSVTRAGQKIGLSQPAMSAALNRLRHIVGDELFARRGAEMRPTARAIELSIPVRQALQQIEAALTPQVFVPEEAKRAFKVAFNDLGAALFLPAMAEQLSRLAPGVDVVVLHADDQRAMNLLDSGEADMAIGLYPTPQERFDSVVLYEAPFVCAMRADHPLAGHPLPLETFAATPQIAIAQQGDPSRHIDRILAEQGLQRRVAVAVPHFLVVPFILAKTDLIAVVPIKLVQRFGATLGLRIADAPFAEMTVPSVLFWNRTMTENAANAWLRSLIVAIARDYKLDRWVGD
jgi:DNA-binding transcriptional LysR family regulator